MYLFDSHCHLQDKRILPDIDALLKRASSAGVKRLSCCSCGDNDWHEVTKISKTYPQVIPSYGVHPWFCCALDQDWDKKLEELIIDDPKAGIGEIGLDHTLEKTTFRLQRDVFRGQIVLAKKCGRPVSIHCRQAWGELIAILKDVQPIKGVIHSYSGPSELVGPLETLGLYLSFSGSVCNPRNKKGARSLQMVSASRLLIETDSPDMLPYGVDQPVNEPANLFVIAQRVSCLRSMAVDDIAALTARNAEKLFSKE